METKRINETIFMDIDDLKLDPSVHQRESENKDVIRTYETDIRQNVKLPPVDAFKDQDGTIWLADGFHRVLAHKEAGINTIEVKVREGTQKDAIIFAAGANAEHGFRRTTGDLRKAVTTLLTMKDFAGKSPTFVAEACKCSSQYVNRIKKELKGQGVQFPSTIEDKNGRLIDTANIAENAQRGAATKAKRANPVTAEVEEEHQQPKLDLPDHGISDVDEYLDNFFGPSLEQDRSAQEQDEPEDIETFSADGGDSDELDGEDKSRAKAKEQVDWKSRALQAKKERDQAIAERDAYKTELGQVLEAKDRLAADLESLRGRYSELQTKYDELLSQVNAGTMLPANPEPFHQAEYQA